LSKTQHFKISKESWYKFHRLAGIGELMVPIWDVAGCFRKFLPICSMVKFLNKPGENSGFALFPIQDLKAKFGFDILFKKFHPKINLTTLLFTKNFFNTIKPLKKSKN
jgi:hypothetical protein